MNTLNLVRKRFEQENGTVLLSGQHYVHIGTTYDAQSAPVVLVLNIKPDEYTGQIEIAEHGVQAY